MSNCEGCQLSPQGQELQLEVIKIQAKEHAEKNSVAVAIYKEGNEYKFMEAFAAYSAGLAPVIVHTVSKYQ